MSVLAGRVVAEGLPRRDAVVAAMLATALMGLDRAVFTDALRVIVVTEPHPDGRSADFMTMPDGSSLYHVYAAGLAAKQRRTCRVMEREAWAEGCKVSLLARILGAAVHEVRHRVQLERPGLRLWDALHHPQAYLALTHAAAMDRALWRIAVTMDAENWQNAEYACMELDAHMVELSAMYRLLHEKEAPPLASLVLLEP